MITGYARVSTDRQRPGRATNYIIRLDTLRSSPAVAALAGSGATADLGVALFNRAAREARPSVAILYCEEGLNCIMMICDCCATDWPGHREL